MSDQTPRRPTRHRASGTATGLGSRLLAPLTAVAVVIAVVGILVVLNGHSAGRSSSSTQAAPRVIPAPSSPLADPSSSRPSPSATPTHSASHPTRHAAATHSASAASASAASAAPADMAPVEILNNSTRTGLAHEVAAQVADRGWQVYFVGNLQGRIAESTVYYAPGEQVAAQHLAEQFGSVARVLPNSEGGLATRDLTLVLTRFWSSG